MLVLTRKRSEMIQIGEDIFIKVIRTGRSTVKIGIQAPPDVRILRAELCEESKVAVKGDVLDPGERNHGEGPLESRCSRRVTHSHVT